MCSRSVSSAASSSCMKLPLVAAPRPHQYVRRTSRVRQALAIRMMKAEEFALTKGRKAVFKAKKSGSIDLAEGTRSLREYMSLPPSEYSVLDADKVTRLDVNLFKCELGSLNFLGTRVAPVLTAEVNVKPNGEGTMIKVVEAEVLGEGLAERANSMFMVVSENDVGWIDLEDGMKQISSDTYVEVHLSVPGWFPFSVTATEKTGNLVMSTVINQVVPRFLDQLKSDYLTWAEGDDSRSATSSGLFDVSQEENGEDMPASEAPDDIEPKASSQETVSVPK